MASGYLTIKAVARSMSLAQLDDREGNAPTDHRGAAPFGGILSKPTLTTDIIPMMVRIQHMTEGESVIRE